MSDEINSVSSTVEPLENMIAAAESKRLAAEAAQVEYETSLQNIAQTHGATYTHNGQVFQIRHRVDSKQGRPITYLCVLHAEPKTWLGGKRKKAEPTAPVTTFTAMTAEEAPAFAAAAASVVSEVGGATVIE